MNHSIIIPHHGREQYLDLCIRSIAKSATVCGVEDYEILVVEYASKKRKSKDRHIRTSVIWPPQTPFNKSRLLNLGIEKAEGEFITILDCDMFVARQWMRSVDLFRAIPRLTRIAYRVRQLTLNDTAELFADSSLADTYFGQFNNPGPFGPGGDAKGRFGRGWEGYGDPERNVVDPDQQPWGNSQFTIRKRDIAGLFYDEGQAGKGWEDVDFNRQIERRFGEKFRGAIFTNGTHGLLHMHHERPESWDSGDIREANLARYRERWETA